MNAGAGVASDVRSRLELVAAERRRNFETQSRDILAYRERTRRSYLASRVGWTLFAAALLVAPFWFFDLQAFGLSPPMLFALVFAGRWLWRNAVIRNDLNDTEPFTAILRPEPFGLFKELGFDIDRYGRALLTLPGRRFETDLFLNGFEFAWVKPGCLSLRAQWRTRYIYGDLDFTCDVFPPASKQDPILPEFDVVGLAREIAPRWHLKTTDIGLVVHLVVNGVDIPWLQLPYDWIGPLSATYGFKALDHSSQALKLCGFRLESHGEGEFGRPEKERRTTEDAEGNLRGVTQAC